MSIKAIFIIPANVFGENKIETKEPANFIKQYNEIIHKKNTVYYAGRKFLIATPNLLYYDGQKEDHNFAGVINYSRNNPHQTLAGRLTAKFIVNALDYSLSTKREEFDIKELYNQSIKIKLIDEEKNSNIEV